MVEEKWKRINRGRISRKGIKRTENARSAGDQMKMSV